jgi:two-component system, NtrC family, C4-dicarboxylate transport sensor histidine kinase DctB
LIRIAAFVTERARLAWTVALLVVVTGSTAAGWLIRERREDERLSRLEIEAQRSGIELMSQTLNGNVMGALSLLGLTDDDVRRDAWGTAPPNGRRISALLEAVGHSHQADGVFIVGQDGRIKSSWDISGKPSTGLDVRFRPYYQMSVKGRDNVYAAVSLARGDRALYFASPVRSGPDRAAEGIGAVVARTGLSRVDALLQGKSDMALLLSPQGVVFATNHPEWIGFLAGTPTPERLTSIRALKQFGTMFDRTEPSTLPFPVHGGILVLDGRRYAQAASLVQWNDPFGDWSLVLMEDLSRTVPARESLLAMAVTGALLLIICGLGLKMLHGHHAQALAARRIEDYAAAQAASAERKTRRAEAALLFQRAKSTEDLAHAFLAQTHGLLGALQGVIYVCDPAEPGTLRLAGRFACGSDTPASLALGEGLLGQCALERKPRLLDITDHQAWTIRSGLGQTRPAAVMMAPLLLDDMVLGVAEIAVLDPPDQHAQGQFVELASLLALNLEIQRRHRGAVAHTAEALS